MHYGKQAAEGAPPAAPAAAPPPPPPPPAPPPPEVVEAKESAPTLTVEDVPVTTEAEVVEVTTVVLLPNARPFYNESTPTTAKPILPPRPPTPTSVS